MDLAPQVREVLKNTANRFKGADRRLYMAQTMRDLGLSQRQANLQLGWSRTTLCKASREITSGIRCLDAFSARGRKPIEHRLPNLLNDIRALVQEQSQADPTFRTTRLYCKMSAAEVRRQLIERKGYTDEQLPTIQTITTKL